MAAKWETDGGQRRGAVEKASVAECLANNQSASIEFLIDGEVVGDTIIINPCGAK